MRQSISEFKASVGPSPERELRFIAEPGRYFVSASTTVASKVYARKGGRSKTQVLYIDDGVYGTFNNVVYDHFEPKPVPLASRVASLEGRCAQEADPIGTSVFGPTCDGLDQICDLNSTKISRVEVDDWLIFENMGAYTHTASFVFNGYTHVPDRVHCISSAALFDADAISSGAESEELLPEPNLARTELL